MVSAPVIVIGAGGHAAVVADALLASGTTVLGFTDAEPSRKGSTLCGLPVLGTDAALDAMSTAEVQLANGIGGVGRPGDVLRRDIQIRLEARGWHFVTVRHPGATLSPFAHVADGAQLLAASVVQAGARVGAGCIVNTATVIEHDVSMGTWTHAAPRALLCGNVVVGTGCHVGAGAIVRQGVRLADYTVVGAGAVVVRDSRCGEVLVGIPARAREQEQ